MTNKNADIARLSFEDGMKELEGLVSRLEGRDIGLEDSLQAFERGHALQLHLSKKLKETELRIEKISQQTSANTEKKSVESAPTVKTTDELPF